MQAPCISRGAGWGRAGRGARAFYYSPFSFLFLFSRLLEFAAACLASLAFARSALSACCAAAASIPWYLAFKGAFFFDRAAGCFNAVLARPSKFAVDLVLPGAGFTYFLLTKCTGHTVPFFPRVQYRGTRT